MQRLFPIILLLTVLAFTNGCATHALWSEADLDTWNEPAQSSNVRLFSAESKQDFLVVYDELSERREVVRTRAYFLNQNEKQIREQKRPKFVSVKSANKLPAIPLRNAAVKDANAPSLYAVVAPNGESFRIYPGPQSISGELPVYNDGMGGAKRIALTPLAVVADLTLVGGFLFAWVWSRGGWSDLH